MKVGASQELQVNQRHRWATSNLEKPFPNIESKILRSFRAFFLHFEYFEPLSHN